MVALFKQKTEEKAYRIYMTDAVRSIGMGKYPKMRWCELISPADRRTGEEIADEVLAKYQAIGGE